MATQVGKYCFCEDHAPDATKLYHAYKLSTEEATRNFDSDMLLQAASQREEYSSKYMSKHADIKHAVFVTMLRFTAKLATVSERSHKWARMLEQFLVRDFNNLYN